MAEQQQGQQGKNTQSQRPPNVSGNADKAASGKSAKNQGQDQNKTGSKDEDQDSSSSSCGSGTCS